MRKSNDKEVLNETVFKQAYPEYVKILERLCASYPTTSGTHFESLVNFKTNKNSPKHKWYDYKHGYSELLVSHIIDSEKPNKELSILDPFCGVGTTNLTAQDKGYNTIGFDINPMAVLASNVKTYHYSENEIFNIKNIIENFILPKQRVSLNGGKVIQTSFTEDVLEILCRLMYFVNNIDNKPIQDFFRLALVAIVSDCSLKVKDGNGLKFKKNYRPIPNLVSFYLEKCTSMLVDIQQSNSILKTKIYFGSMMDLDSFSRIESEKIGLCIFSPPYANCFDYCEVYKLEFWIGGFVKSYEDFETYRSLAMRSHVNSKFNHSLTFENRDVEIIANLISTFNIWNKNIPDMLRGYFDDMERLLFNLKDILVDGGKCYIVVANSGYKGILVPTDLLIADISQKYGFKVNNIFHARKIRSSSQQMEVLGNKYDNLMSESVIELELKK